MSNGIDESRKPIALSREAIDAVIFDLDGVVTDTAALHAAAWKTTFDAFLEARAAAQGESLQPFDIETDYRDHVDGKPRYDGVLGFLDSRGIALAMGEADDAPGFDTVCALGNRKNALFRDLLAREGPEPIRSTIDFIRGLRARGFRTAVVTSSRNGRAVLDGARIAGLFDAVFDGNDAETLGLAGKPDPAVFVEAARRLGVDPARAVVVEDAVAGVQAGRAGGFGLTVGLARRTDRGALRRNGADVVVASLGEMALDGETAEARVAIGDLPSAIDHIAEILGAPGAPPPAVFLDYDGTLTPIVARPELATLGEPIRSAIRDLAGCATVAIVSGRDIGDVRALVGIDEISYAGDHGFRISGPDGREVRSEHGTAFRPVLVRAKAELDAALAGIDGVLLEPKFATVAVHYRLAGEADARRVEAVVDRVVASHAGLRKTFGKKVFEVQPDIDWDKGKALLWLIASLGIRPEDRVIVYIGDDLTDEDAFRALPPHGAGIVVRDGEDRPTAARYRLDDPDQVRVFLERLADAERRRS